MTSAQATREWGLLLKARIKPEEPAAAADQLERLVAALPGEDKRLSGGGRDFTIAWWVEAADAASATRIGAAAVRREASAVGLDPKP